MRDELLVILPCALLALAVCSAAGAAPRFERTTHPDAQWFPQAGLGLFMHWGIHSVPGIQPSWAMIKDYPHGADPRFHPPEKYYALAREFDPQSYDPDKWMRAAAEAGFTYAVLTAKHHDGYALWPTHFGDMSTRQYMNGRDLLQPYVGACRKHGLKVGFYFSPVDWHYPGYPVGDAEFDFNKRGQQPPREPVQNQKDFDAFYEYTIGQLGELLTRYGKIDLIWFDGMGWTGIQDIRTEQTLQWVRDLQPGIVINPRWGGVGDFGTPEWDFPGGRPSGWWEYCIAWNGHWGYNPGGRFRPTSWVMETLVKCRSWGGNFLLNVGPAPDGTMPPGFYEHSAELAAWMAHSRKSLIGALPTPGEDLASVLITQGERAWYLHVLPGQKGNVEVRDSRTPKSVKLLATGEELPFARAHGTLVIEMPAQSVTGLNDVVELVWDG